ncbi:hypothetical protein HM1_0012 [Heliomicrobium modesticaldum Ice1]|uniref:Uncharacterized protein n=1 Tax=Heliobacterium modesticaldum (strain ATCC 51547 / Ice1) TaxID=498761 RepID=B0THW4_HELMI|nr:hypothetical protein HM1_0012 [Heliomicrobium modesticaldum Ice1]
MLLLTLVQFRNHAFNEIDIFSGSSMCKKGTGQTQKGKPPAQR